MQEQLDQDAVNLAKAIRQVESNNNFNARGKSGEFGAYQFMPETWASSSRAFLKRDVPVDRATPQEQNEVAYKQVKQWKDAGYNPGQIASMWNAGPGKPNAYIDGNKGVNQYGAEYDTAAYAKKVAETYKQMKGGLGGSYAPPPQVHEPEVSQEQTAPEEKGIVQKGLEFLFPILEKKERTPLQTIGDVGMSALTLVPGAGLLKGASMASKVGKLGALGYGADVASKLGEGETDIATIATPGLGTAVGATGGVAAGLLSKAATPILSRTSGVPQGAFEVASGRPGLVNTALKAGVTPESTRQVATGAVRNLRSKMTTEWKEGVDKLITTYEGRRVGLPESVANELQDIASRYNTSTKLRVRIPNNPQNLSIKELTDLITDINGLPYKAVDPDRAVGDMGKYLKNLGKTSFDDAGEFTGLYSQYAKRKEILDAADDIVRTYNAKNPIAKTTAINRLQKIFDEDKEEYLKAIQALEKETGVDILSQVAAGKFSPRMPRDLSKGADLNDIIQMLLLPLTSPRGALWFSKFFGSGAGPATSGLKGLLQMTPVGAAQLDDVYTQ